MAGWRPVRWPDSGRADVGTRQAPRLWQVSQHHRDQVTVLPRMPISRVRMLRVRPLCASFAINHRRLRERPSRQLFHRAPAFHSCPPPAGIRWLACHSCQPRSQAPTSLGMAAASGLGEADRREADRHEAQASRPPWSAGILAGSPIRRGLMNCSIASAGRADRPLLAHDLARAVATACCLMMGSAGDPPAVSRSWLAQGPVRGVGGPGAAIMRGVAVIEPH
jgi:hypothetical protein